ncbi:DNA excision repair protein ERCC-6-like 2 [Boleophthalmus pectinirostris]|uniref:DNA excision repair protein ERCC-6-like 2 n=1 Tax=Boleophthalmus pectinirostris TaxID=150288 RepID=UPI00242C3751|nr:DNA excision repair protein ERCC-6-like 2 [Boleophthalmus pectinirostris]
MASSAASSSEWHEGNTCLAPDSKDGILREATIRRLSSSSSTSKHPDTAWLIFKDHGADAVEESVPVSKLKKTNITSLTQEKPFFSGTVINSNLCVPLELCYEHKVPYTINRYLREYQREGIKFMYNNYIHSRGCVLGDDMGLGKTVQVIGFLAAILHKKGTWEDIENNRPSFLQSQACNKQTSSNKVFLIVAPLSVLYNWKDELETWGHFQCVVVHGLKKEEELNRIRKGRIEVALTTYETLRLCLDLFNDIDWSAVIVDEAHKIKNPSSQITQAMKELNCQIRIGLTGTILQNNLEELWCVMDWAVPKCLGSLGHFKTKFSEPIEQGQKHNATKRALAVGRKSVRALVKKISHYFLRRTKSLIKEQLPKKDDRVVYCSLTDFQRTVYQTVLDSEDVRLLLRSSEKCDCGSRHTRRRCCYKANSEGVEMKKLYFTYLAILRKIASHVALLQSSAGTSKNQKKYVGIICEKVFQQFPDFVQRCKHESFEALSDPMYSGKMKVLQKLLHHYRQRKDKILLFSLSTKLLDVLESYCMAEGLDYSRLDGNTKSKERVQIVKEFNSSSHINICLVSTMAGGLGLNFVGANVVVLFDPTWNPANDLQAIDRAYRIGQCRDVTVLRLISLGTVEEVIYLRQVYKQQLHSSVVAVESARRYFEAVQGDDAQKGELFGIKNLFRLQTQGTCLTRQILEREGQVEAGVTTARTHMGEEKEEEAKAPEEHVKDSTISASKNNTAKVQNKDTTKLPRGVLDFSSGSDDDEGITKKLSDPYTNEANTSTPGRMTLLQHGFSKLLQRIKGTPDSIEGGISNVDDSSSDDDNQHSSSNLTNFTTLKDSDKLKKEEFKILSDSEPDEKDVSKKEQISKTKKRKAFVPLPNIFQSYSDESEDLDIEVMTSNRKKVPKRTATVGEKSKTRQKLGPNKVKFTEEIEAFSSSEDEQMRKKPRPKGSRFNSPVKERVTSNNRGFVTPEKQSRVSKTYSQSPQSKNGSIDTVLGGVQEVAYTHSNQRVVGGSRAEELISRAAVRDVFERKLFSQMPANHLLGTQESSSESPPDSPPIQSRTTSTGMRPRVEHPVTFRTRITEQTRHTTFIVGETPQTICRQQLEDMATKLHFSSVEQFAKEVLRSASNQRLSWLRRYYTSLDHPDLASTITKHFPQSVSAKPSSSASSKASSCAKIPHNETTKTTAKATSSPKKGSKRSNCQEAKLQIHEKKEKMDPFENIPSPEADWPEEKVEVTTEFIKKRQRKDSRAINLTSFEANFSNNRDSKVSHKSPNTLAKSTFQKTKDVFENIPSPEADWPEEKVEITSEFIEKRTKKASGALNPTSFLSHKDSEMNPNLPAPLAKPTFQETTDKQKMSKNSQEPKTDSGSSTSANDKSFLTDLIGDTSILDDLFKPKKNSPKTANSTSVLSSKPSSSKDSPVPALCEGSSSKTILKKASKDFWDVLQEGDEESLNRLTDLAEVQRVCVSTNIAARNHYKEEENKRLWKTNEKFLWKK